MVGDFDIIRIYAYVSVCCQAAWFVRHSFKFGYSPVSPLWKVQFGSYDLKKMYSMGVVWY
jgi:hypothetical protein